MGWLGSCRRVQSRAWGSQLPEVGAQAAGRGDAPSSAETGDLEPDQSRVAVCSNAAPSQHQCRGRCSLRGYEGSVRFLRVFITWTVTYLAAFASVRIR